ncbi:NmrA family NAD(P)-binding protein, partial [Xanthovirga aplysinae]|uniref:NmrA family NAD(P)-binding protein n=1 Tax=Xanthovirga aplysinae TaxID=2529853 RepID=UPI001656BD59
MNYLVFGATGNIGKVVATNLLKAGKAVNVVGRNPEKLKELEALGATIISGDINHPVFLKDALKDIDAAFVMTPPFYDAEDHSETQKTVANIIGDAIEQSNLKHVVNLSSSGVENPDKFRLLAGVEQVENRLNAIKNLHVLHLRPTYFLENFLANLPIVNQGIFGSMLEGNVSFAPVTTQDIGEYAANRLLELDFNDKNQIELRGPEQVTSSQISEKISEAIGKPLKYIQFPYQDAIKAMTDSGIFKESAAENLADLCKALNEGELYTSDTKHVKLKSGIKDFAQVFKVIY